MAGSSKARKGGRPSEPVAQDAGQKETPFGRRAKISLESIDRKQIMAAGTARQSVLEAKFNGRDKKGEPACATVLLWGGGWALV